MPKLDTYRDTLRHLAAWDDYLLKESGLPGPRANLELVQAAADLGTPEQFRRWLAMDAAATPPKTALEFLPLCGTVGLGRLLAEGQLEVLAELRRCAADPRWRVREGVAMALQHWGDEDMAGLVKAMKAWSGDRAATWLERRAAAAALCEPRLLADGRHVKAVLRILDAITTAMLRAETGARKDEDYKTLRQALGYCWSVAVAASPADGQAAMEKWMSRKPADPDVRWIMKQNLKKNRLARVDAGWVKRWQAKIG